MIDIEKQIAETTLKKLHTKSWRTLTLDDVIGKSKKTFSIPVKVKT